MRPTCPWKLSSTATMSLALLACALHLPGCDRQQSAEQTGKSDSRATDPSQLAGPTTAATQPTATLNINGTAISFPSAKLVLMKKPGGMEAILCSDDPPAAIESTYHGNSFMFDMKLDVDDREDLPSAVWEFKLPKKDARETTDGIFLNGARRQMQPAEVKVTFEKQGDRIVASLNGQFNLSDSRDVTAPTQSVTVDGRLDAVVQEQK